MCVDVLEGTIVAVDPLGGPQRYPVPSRAATVIRHRTNSGFVIATEHGVVVADDGLTTFENVAEVIQDPALRTNEGGCDPLGGFVIGTMSYNEQPDGGAVYRVTSNGQVCKILAPVSVSNGVQWSADGSRVYYIDTATRRVDVFDIDSRTGAWSGRRPHIRIDGLPGFPDGMAIDEEDGLWIAMWGGGTVLRYDNSGRHIDTIAVPGVTLVSSCTFGGKLRDILYITTSRKDISPGREPDAGAVFAIQTAVRGAAPAEFPR
jgi:sugar lactone lactonase YvrE